MSTTCDRHTLADGADGPLQTCACAASIIKLQVQHSDRAVSRSAARVLASTAAAAAAATAVRVAGAFAVKQNRLAAEQRRREAQRKGAANGEGRIRTRRR